MTFFFQKIFTPKSVFTSNWIFSWDRTIFGGQIWRMTNHITWYIGKKERKKKTYCEEENQCKLKTFINGRPWAPKRGWVHKLTCPSKRSRHILMPMWWQIRASWDHRCSETREGPRCLMMKMTFLQRVTVMKRLMKFKKLPHGNTLFERFKFEAGRTDCCCHHLLFNQPIFEQYWRAVKFHYRGFGTCPANEHEMEKHILQCLDDISLLQIRWFMINSNTLEYANFKYIYANRLHL